MVLVLRHQILTMNVVNPAYKRELTQRPGGTRKKQVILSINDLRMEEI